MRLKQDGGLMRVWANPHLKPCKTKIKTNKKNVVHFKMVKSVLLSLLDHHHEYRTPYIHTSFSVLTVAHIATYDFLQNLLWTWMIFSPDHPVSRDRHYSGICHMPFEKKCRGSFLPICKVTLEESNLSSLITYPKKYPLSWIYILFGNSNSGKKKTCSTNISGT